MKNQQEIMEALLRGDKIGCTKFKYTEYIHLVDGELVDENGVEQYIVFIPETYSIWIPPKPTPEEVLVALGQGKWVVAQDLYYSWKHGELIYKRVHDSTIYPDHASIEWVIEKATAILGPEEGQ